MHALHTNDLQPKANPWWPTVSLRKNKMINNAHNLPAFEYDPFYGCAAEINYIFFSGYADGTLPLLGNVRYFAIFASVRSITDLVVLPRIFLQMRGVKQLYGQVPEMREWEMHASSNPAAKYCWNSEAWGISQHFVKASFKCATLNHRKDTLLTAATCG